MLRFFLVLISVCSLYSSNQIIAQDDPFAQIPKNDPFAPKNQLDAAALSPNELPQFDAFKAHHEDVKLRRIRPQDLIDLIDSKKNIHILDARDKKEFDISHIEDAIRIGYSDFSIEKVWSVDREERVIVYSSVSKRGAVVAQYLSLMGFADVEILEDGIINWKNEGNEIFDEDGKTDKIHVGDRANLKMVKRGRAIL